MSNLVKRSLSGLVFLAVVIGCLLCPCGYAALLLFVIVAAAFETLTMLVPGKRYNCEKVLVTISCAASFILCFLCFNYGFPQRFILTALLPLIAAYIFLLYNSSVDYDFPAGIFFPVPYVAVPACCSLFLAYPGGNFTGKLLLVTLVLIWSCDVGAYCFGMMFGQKEGRRKLFPALSPRKSWAGAVGGFVCTMIAAVAVATFANTAISLVHWIVMAVIVSTVGVFGDLFESLLKRHAGVKDSGNIIPGHGGMLDRFDGFLFVIPTIVVYLKLFDVI